jgi:MFS family permease
MRRVQRTALWRHPDFSKLWVGQTISPFGSEVTSLALPLTAVLVLHATPAQMGFLAAAVYAPGLLVSLFAGVWVDRVRRRPLLIGADVSRALLLALIPVAALLHLMRIEQLYVVSFAVGVLTTLFTVAYQSFLPAVVSTDRLADANSKLTASASLAQIAGPALAGALVQLVTAPLAILVDALSFLASALFLARMRITDEGPGRHGPRKDIWREMGDGLCLTFGQPLLRTFAVSAGTNNLFGTLFSAVLVLYVTRRLGIGPAVLGVISRRGAGRRARRPSARGWTDCGRASSRRVDRAVLKFRPNRRARRLAEKRPFFKALPCSSRAPPSTQRP